MPAPATLSEIVQAFVTAAKDETHTAIVAVVDAYDAATQTCTVTPVVKAPVRDGSYAEPLTLKDVPVAVTRGGGFFASMPLTKGDHVLLVFNQWAIGDWRTTGNLAEPKDTATHTIGYPVAFPCVAPDSQPIADASGTKVVIGKDGTDAQIEIDAAFVAVGKGATSFIAKADALATNLSNIKGALDTIAAAAGTSHTYVPTSCAATVGKVK